MTIEVTRTVWESGELGVIEKALPDRMTAQTAVGVSRGLAPKDTPKEAARSQSRFSRRRQVPRETAKFRVPDSSRINRQVDTQPDRERLAPRSCHRRSPPAGPPVL